VCDDVLVKETVTCRRVFADATSPFATARSSSAHGVGSADVGGASATGELDGTGAAELVAGAGAAELDAAGAAELDEELDAAGGVGATGAV
jgi:hypothetical protein